MSWLDTIPFVPSAIGVGVLYGGYFVTSAVALVCLLAAPDEQWPVDLAAITLFVTSGLHFLLHAFGYAFLTDYEFAPVAPEWAFLFADCVQAGALGACIASYSLSPAHSATPLVGSVVTMLSQLLCFYKSYTLVTDVWAGKRDEYTGRKL